MQVVAQSFGILCRWLQILCSSYASRRAGAVRKPSYTTSNKPKPPSSWIHARAHAPHSLLLVPCLQLNAVSFEKDDDTNYHMQVSLLVFRGAACQQCPQAVLVARPVIGRCYRRWDQQRHTTYQTEGFVSR